MKKHHRLASLAALGLVAATIAGCTTAPPSPLSSTTSYPIHSSTTDAPRPIATTAAPATPPAPPADTRVSWIGDALTLQSERLGALAAPGRELTWFTSPELDARQAARLIADPANRGRVGGTTVVALGTFAPISSVSIDELLRALGPEQSLVLVTPGVRSSALPWTSAVSALYRRVAEVRPRTQVVDWQVRVDRSPELLASNGVTLAEDLSAANAWVGAVNQAIESTYRVAPPVMPVQEGR
ncbi:hypothetical protein [Gordonia sihwensis]|uniref:hypothetical protein n=1 Tax=Gordonia sihwensis TaxID=173559 RepID=UPI003D99AB2E